MTWIITKYFLTAAVVVLISELAKRSDKLGAFVARPFSSRPSLFQNVGEASLELMKAMIENVLEALKDALSEFLGF